MLALPHQEVNQEAAPEEAADKINNKTKIQLKRNDEDSHLGIFHFLYLVHLLMEEHGLDGLEEADLSAMLRFANTAAYLVTTKKGAIKSMPERSQVEALLK